MKPFVTIINFSICVMASGGAWAQAAARDFDIPAGDMKRAIDRYAAQSGEQVLYRVADMDGLMAQAVKGRMTPDTALARLLKGSPLRILRDGPNAAVLVRTPVPPKAPRPATPKPLAEAPGGPATVLVSGSRAGADHARDLKRDSDAIVDAITADDIDSLPSQNIAEVAQRIPGVQMQRYMEEGGAFAVRGLKQAKVLLNGMETHGARSHPGEYNGRNFDLEDLPSEVVAGVEVGKSALASDIEGGLGSNVNVRTRQPFDAKGSVTGLSVKATRFQMAPGFDSKTRALASALISRRWHGPVGDMGLLVNLARNGGAFGLTENEVQRPQVVRDYAGSGHTVTLPIGMFTGKGHSGERQRNTQVAAFQWRPNASMSLFANYLGIDYRLDQDFQTARLYVGQPGQAYTLWGDRNHDGSDNLRSGTFTDNTMTGASVLGHERRKAKLYDMGAKWTSGGGTTIKARLSRNRTVVRNTLLEWGTTAGVPLMNLTVNDGAPSRLSISGVDVADPSSHHPSYLLSIAAKGTQKNTALALDGHTRVDHALVHSIDAGLRRNDYTRHAYGYVHQYCIDGCASGRSLATADPALLHQVPFSQSREIGAYPTFSTAAVRQQRTLRSLYGLPLTDPDLPEHDQLNRETSTAGYLKLNFQGEVAARPVDGNLGVRYVHTRLRSRWYDRNAAGALARRTRDASRRDVLPSFNARMRLRDALQVRVAASRTLGQLNFSHLSPTVQILNPVQRDAQAGDPDLPPYTSRNLDLALERYVGRDGMAFVAAFTKSIHGMVQTVVDQRLINGTAYNVTSFRSAGRSTIKGLEVGYQQRFAALPAPFSGLGMQANCIHVDAQAPSSVAGQSVPWVGLSRHSCSVIGLYERHKVRARLAYSYRSSFVTSTSSSGAQGVPISAKRHGTLDAAIGYDIAQQVALIVEAANLTGARIEQYYGTPHRQMNFVPLNKRYGVQLRLTY